MKFLSGLTIGLFRQTRDGRRVIGFRILPGHPSAWYQVSDAAAPRVERRFRQFFAATGFVAVPVAVVLFGTSWWTFAALALLWPPLAMRYWVLHDLPRTHVEKADLEPLDRKARDLAQAQAIGEPMLWLLVVAGILMAALGLYVALSDGVWWAWLSVVMFVVLSLLMARSIIAVRRARR